MPPRSSGNAPRRSRVVQTRETSTPSARELPAPPLEIRTALKVLSGKWTLMILCQLSKRTVRFNELKRSIPGVTQHMLTARLRELERSGLISRKVYAEVPPKVDYSMTPHGRSLKPVIETLGQWGRLHLNHRR